MRKSSTENINRSGSRGRPGYPTITANPYYQSRE